MIKIYKQFENIQKIQKKQNFKINQNPIQIQYYDKN